VSWADAADDDVVGDSTFLTPMLAASASTADAQRPSAAPAASSKGKREKLKASATTFTEEFAASDEWTVVGAPKPAPPAAATATATAAAAAAPGRGAARGGAGRGGARGRGAERGERGGRRNNSHNSNNAHKSNGASGSADNGAAAAPAAPTPAPATTTPAAAVDGPKVNAWEQRRAAQEAAEAERLANAPVILPPGSAVIGDDDDDDDNDNNDDDNNNDDNGEAVAGVRRDVRQKARNGKTVRTNLEAFGAHRVREAQFRVGSAPKSLQYGYGNGVVGGISGNVDYSLGKKKRWELVQEGQPLPTAAELGILPRPSENADRVDEAAAAAAAAAEPRPVVRIANTAGKTVRGAKEDIRRMQRELDRRNDQAETAAREARETARTGVPPERAAPEGWAVVRSRKGDVVKQKREPGKRGVRQGGDDADASPPHRPAGGRTGDHPNRRRRGDDDDADVDNSSTNNHHGRRAPPAAAAPAAAAAPTAAVVETVAFIDTGARSAGSRDGESRNYYKFDRQYKSPKATNARVLNKDISQGRF
jgi:hypothetical protein